MSLIIEHNIADLNKALALYQKLSTKSVRDILIKQGTKLRYSIWMRERQIMAKKGEIRAMVLARLKSGKMINIRDSIVGGVDAKLAKSKKHSKMTGSQRAWTRQQALVAREINIRESGRGFISVSSRYPRSLSDQAKALSRRGLTLSQWDLKADYLGGRAQLIWASPSGPGQKVAKALEDRRPRAALALALKDVKDDIMEYVNDKMKWTAEEGIAYLRKK